VVQIKSSIRLTGNVKKKKIYFIHSFKNFYSISSSSLLLRGAPDSSMVKKNSLRRR